MLDVLRVIGKRLDSLVLWVSSVEDIDLIVEFCPNLQNFDLSKGCVRDEEGGLEEMDQDIDDGVSQKLKSGLIGDGLWDI
jgi:hypothetical protein